ncbi:MAG: hypothetical protein HC844_02460 [Tabrizicola sp.]|nr:hypothetical protein [Tabrizicola sp.]
MAEGFQGHHSTPWAIFDKNRGLFEEFLPGWNADGKYNFELRANSQAGAIQMDGLLHMNNHKWLNDIAEKASVGWVPTHHQHRRPTQTLEFPQ